MKKLRWLLQFLLVMAAFLLVGCGAVSDDVQPLSETVSAVMDSEGSVYSDGADGADEYMDTETELSEDGEIHEDGTYTDKESVALYIHTYGKLPRNFMTKNEAKNLGWDSSKGNLQDVAPGMSIGGDRFGNYEGLLPEADGRKYYECDINYEGGYRGGERIVFSNDGLIYYTGDHYESFELLYE